MEPGDPEAEELRGMSAFDGGEEQFKERLGTLAKAHWDKITTVKEGETIINFAYAVRMRSECVDDPAGAACSRSTHVLTRCGLYMLTRLDILPASAFRQARS